MLGSNFRLRGRLSQLCEPLATSGWQALMRTYLIRPQWLQPWLKVRLFQRSELVSSLMSIILEAGCQPVIDFYLVFNSMGELSRKGICPGSLGL